MESQGRADTRRCRSATAAAPTVAVERLRIAEGAEAMRTRRTFPTVNQRMYSAERPVETADTVVAHRYEPAYAVAVG